MRNFEEEIALINPEIKLLEKVKNGSTKVRCKCLKDGYEWETRPYDLLRGFGCHACAGVPRYNTETFKKALGKVNESIIIVSEYKGAHKHIDYICGRCGENKRVKAHQLLNGHGCKDCGYKDMANKNRKTLEVFQKEVFDLTGIEYEVFGEYKHTDTDIGFIHKACGFSFQTRPHNFLNGARCPKCNGGVRKKDDDYFRTEVEEISNKEYEFIGNYKGIHKEVAFRHIECGSEFKTTPTSFLHQGTRCPDCYFISKGELAIKEILLDQQIKFEQQKTFEGLIDRRKLRFDFFLPDFNLCIEYDGQQHFEPKEHWGGIEALVELQRRDSLKNEYCANNGIGLLRIHYGEKNVRGLVEGILNVRQHPDGIERAKNVVLL